jgi:hypothetical protein
MDPYSFGCPGRIRICIGHWRIRIREHLNRPKFTNKPCLLVFFMSKINSYNLMSDQDTDLHRSLMVWLLGAGSISALKPMRIHNTGT